MSFGRKSHLNRGPIKGKTAPRGLPDSTASPSPRSRRGRKHLVASIRALRRSAPRDLESQFEAKRIAWHFRIGEQTLRIDVYQRDSVQAGDPLAR